MTIGPRGPASVALAALVVGLTACGSPFMQVPDAGRSPGPERDPAADGPQFDTPPPVTVRAGGKSFALEAWTYCYDTGCADGMPPVDPPDLGQAPRVDVEFPLNGWTFEAEFVPVGDACPRRHSVPVDRTGEGTYVVVPAGHADTYDVTLFGRGNGDLFVTFRWTTPTDGPMPVPHARLAVLADHDGAVDSYGVELELSDLAATPQRAEAQVTVTAANGEALTFDATRAPGCFAEGTIYWDGPAQAGLAAAQLGPAPFTYEVIVTLDGAPHTATATWPADELDGNEPSVSLDFAPPLPALP